jgi:type IV pilus assembly protein PilA
MRDSKGFSLIELLIVVAIILIIAAIAIPSLLRARMAAHESGMVADARTVLVAEETYAAVAGAAADMPCLANPSVCYTGSGTEPMIDASLGSANMGVVKNGYRRTFTGDGLVLPAGTARTVNHHANYTYEGVPVAVGATGQRAFCIDRTGVICTDPTGVGICAGATAIVNCPAGQSLGQ